MKKLTIVIFLIMAWFCCVTGAQGQVRYGIGVSPPPAHIDKSLSDSIFVQSEEEFELEFRHYLLEGEDSVAFNSFDGVASWPEVDGFSLIYKVGETTFAAPFNQWLSLVNETEDNLAQHKINFASSGALPYVATQDSALISLNFIAPTVFETIQLPVLTFFNIDENPFLYSNTITVVVRPVGVNNEDSPKLLPQDLATELYPNPNPSNLVLKQRLPGYVTVEVYDMLGRSVKTVVQDSYLHNTSHVNLSLNDLSSGTYLIVARNNTTTLAKSFNIAR